MNQISKHIFFLVFIFLYGLLYSQKLNFVNYTTKDGLLSDEVYNLQQDKKGYIWLFTNYGPMIYNGKKFSPALKNLPFEESIIYAFYENEKGQKWIANSNKNIYEIINDQAIRVKGTNIKSKQLKNSIYDIYQVFVDDSLNIYTRTSVKTTLFLNHNNYGAIDLEEKFDYDSCLYHVIEKENGLISILNKHEKLNGKKENFFSIKFIDPSTPKKNFRITYRGNSKLKYFKKFKNDIYFNSLNTLVKVNPDHSTKDVITTEPILNFTKDKNNHLWIACYGNGLYELDEHDSLINHYFKGKTVHDVLVDSENGLWLTTDGSGIYYCRHLNELYFGDEHPFGQPVNFIKKLDNKVFVGSTDHHLYLIEDAKTIQISKKNKRLNDDPVDIVHLNQSFIVYYRLHAEELKGPTLVPSALPLINPAFLPYKVFNCGYDSLIYISRNRIGIMKNSASILSKGIGLKQLTTKYKLFYCKKRHADLLIATEDGVFCLRGDSLIRPNYLKATENCKVTKILEDAFGDFWFCTKGHGLFKLNQKNKLLKYNLTNGLPSNIVNDIYFKEDHSVLLSSNVGLYYYPNSALLKNPIKLFNAEVQKCIPVKSVIYLATKKGLIILNFKSSIQQTKLFFNLRSIYVNSKHATPTELTHLAYYKNNIDFRFDLISFTEKYYPLKYKLLGSSSADTGVVFSDKISFRNLAPGNYTLTVYPIIKNASEEAFITEQFNIIPAFWQTLWFIFSCFSLGIVISGYIIWLFLSYVSNKKLKKAEANRILAEYSLIALKAQISPHFMANCLAAIQYLIVSNKIDDANQYLAKFSFLVRQALNFSTSFFISLKEEIEIVHLYVELEQLRFEHKFKFSLTIDPAIPINEFQIPSLLLQPIIENSIWQGLFSLSPDIKAELALNIHRDGDLIKIKIRDNGISRKTNEDPMDPLNSSNGITITRKRLETLKEIYHYEVAEIGYEELVTIGHQVVGTQITIILPFHLSKKS